MMNALGKPRAKVIVCKDPSFDGVDDVSKWGRIQQAIDRHRGMIDLFLLCVDRDADPHRHERLRQLEDLAAMNIGVDRIFLAEHAWQELEVWILAGHDLPKGWNWATIRAERDPKETYYLPFAEGRGVVDRPAQGRGTLAIEAASRYERIRRLCPEDVDALHAKIGRWLSRPPG